MTEFEAPNLTIAQSDRYIAVIKSITKIVYTSSIANHTIYKFK